MTNRMSPDGSPSDDDLIDGLLSMLDPLDDDGFVDRFQEPVGLDVVSEVKAIDLLRQRAESTSGPGGGRTPSDVSGPVPEPELSPMLLGSPAPEPEVADSVRHLPRRAAQLIVAAAAIVFGFGIAAVLANRSGSETTVSVSSTVEGTEIVETPSTTTPDENETAASSPPPPSTSVPAEPEDATPVIDQSRDPLIQPFEWDSIWNMPIGSDASYRPAGMTASKNGTTFQESVVILRPDAPPKPIYMTEVGWGLDLPPRCSDVDSDKPLFDGEELPIPDSFLTEGKEIYRNAGNVGVILDADGRTVWNTAPLHLCGEGLVASRIESPKDDLFGDGLVGGQPGSGMSSLGGTIRVADIEAGRIPHAIKLAVDGRDYLSPEGGGFRWPAVRANDYVADNSGGRCNFNGDDPALQLGTLLALPAGFDPSTMRTEMGGMVARALVDYGGYVVSNPCDSVFGLVTEWGPDGRVLDTVEERFGIDVAAGTSPDCESDDPTCRYTKDMADIASALAIVENNAAETPGGPGTRVAPCAAPFADGTGGPPAGSVCD